MKKVAVFIVVTTLLAGCNVFNKSLSNSGEKEKKLVYEILQIMVDGEEANTKLRKYIAPSYYADNNLSKEKLLIDNFSPAGFSIDSYNKNTGYVVGRIWGNERSWVHRLTFMVVVEKNKLYVMPSKHSLEYIKPWYKDERNVE